MKPLICSLLLCCALTLPGDAQDQFVIQRAVIQQLEDGPPVGPNQDFIPGETVFFSCFIDGYKLNDGKRVQISYHIEARDPMDVPIIAEIQDKVEAQLQEQDKNWRPKIRQEILVPPFAPPGKYAVRIAAKDEIGGKTAVHEVTFSVRAREVAPSDTLVVRSFGYYRGENDQKPLEIAAYRPGETLWARFDITGYKFGPGNKLDVSYQISVSTAEGRELFRQVEPTVEQTESFYPRRYVPCMINLNLQQNIAPGSYKVTVDAKDAIGDQTTQLSGTFQVE
jgi:hypothetical protein